MKNLLNKIIALLVRVPEDRYQHFALGSLIAFLSALCFCWLPLWAMEIISMLITFVAAVGKELWDDYVDWIDIITTLCGGSIIWITLLL